MVAFLIRAKLDFDPAAASESDEFCLLKESSFYDFRNKFVDIDGPLLGAKAIVSHFCKEHCTKIKIARLDATYVLPNIANRSRGGLFQEFLRFSVREHLKAFPEGKGGLDQECLNRYDESRKVGNDRYSQAKAKEKPLIREQMARDAESFVRRFRYDPRVYCHPNFKILRMFVREKCDVLSCPDGGEPEFRVKDPRDLAADSLQNPHDTGATYSGNNKVKGRKLQVAEASTETRKNMSGNPVFNLVIHIDTHGALMSDVHAVGPLLDFLARTGICVEVILIDNAYNTFQNTARPLRSAALSSSVRRTAD
jgi:hypothetical protein